ncbi:MAG: ABC transporter ATP-binding protein [Rhizobiales bacterium]|nr:ABC transporter ATP-binding protein [Hyphomicrobiales bacterium]
MAAERRTRLRARNIPTAGPPCIHGRFSLSATEVPRSSAGRQGRPALTQATAKRVTAVDLAGVAVAFGVGESAYCAVGRADVAVSEHEFVAIVGPTGCGKSTLLNVVAGLLSPAGGQARVFGRPVAGVTREAGYLFQADALMPWKTALDNVAVALEVGGVRRAEALARGRDWLAQVGLRGFEARYPHQLSGGQRKRVAMAQMLIRDPKILLMDEPFGPLDAQTRALMGDLLLSLWSRDRKAVLFVTHDLEEAIALADRVVVMSAGPASHIVSEHVVDLPRPRDANEVRLEPRFHALQKAIWSDLRDEVMKAYSGAAAGAAS